MLALPTQVEGRQPVGDSPPRASAHRQDRCAHRWQVRRVSAVPAHQPSKTLYSYAVSAGRWFPAATSGPGHVFQPLATHAACLSLYHISDGGPACGMSPCTAPSPSMPVLSWPARTAICSACARRCSDSVRLKAPSGGRLVGSVVTRQCVKLGGQRLFLLCTGRPARA